MLSKAKDRLEKERSKASRDENQEVRAAVRRAEANRCVSDFQAVVSVRDCHCYTYAAASFSVQQ